jgi:S-adenosylmethionine decarboxylase proenzyme
VNASGIQLLAELHNCDASVLDDVSKLRELVCSAIETNGFNLVNVTCHHFDPAGVTVVAIISESHVCLHTFPESAHISLDVFHCGSDKQSLLRLLGELERRLMAEGVRFLLVERGKDSLSLLKED